MDHIWLDLKKDVELKGHSLTEVGVPVLSQLFQERVNDWLSKSETQPFKSIRLRLGSRFMLKQW